MENLASSPGPGGGGQLSGVRYQGKANILFALIYFWWKFSTNTEFARPEIPPSAGLFCEVYKRALLQQEQAVLAVQGWAVKSRWECLDLRDSYVSMQLAVSMSHGVALHHLLVRRGEVHVTHLHMYAEESHNYAKTLHLSERSKVRSYKRRNLQSIHKQAHSITRYPPKKGKVTKGIIR